MSRWVVNHSRDFPNDLISKKLERGDLIIGLPKPTESYDLVELIRLGFYGVYEEEKQDGSRCNQTGYRANNIK